MSENFASFEYKTQEEVLTVAKSLTSVLSTAGMQLVDILSPSHLLAQLHGPNHTPQTQLPPSASEVAMDVDSHPLQTDQPPRASIAPPRCQDFGMLHSSVIVAMIMLLKTHLKTLYGLSEEYESWSMRASIAIADHIIRKCAKFIIGKKSAVGDRPATRKHERPLSWDSLPFAIAPMVTSEDMDAQSRRVGSYSNLSWP